MTTNNAPENFLSHTETFMNHVYWIKQDFCLQPNKQHTATAINYADLKERRHDFLRELKNTVISWVYSKEKTRKILDERLLLTGDYGNASAFLMLQALSKFRPGQPQGQFGELLLFNFIQYFFSAAPLLRKQCITTSPGLERFGADAIHYKKEGEKNVFLLGESKCYQSKYKFKEAFEASLESISTTFENLEQELDLYTYDDFISPEFEQIAKSFKLGKLPNVYFELLCLIAYNETTTIIGKNEDEIKKHILEVVRAKCKSLDKNIYSKIHNSGILDRINYIVFPIWKFESLLEKFQTASV